MLNNFLFFWLRAAENFMNEKINWNELKLEVETRRRLDHRGIEGSQVLVWVLSIGLCKNESNVESLQEQGDEDS